MDKLYIICVDDQREREQLDRYCVRVDGGMVRAFRTHANDRTRLELVMLHSDFGEEEKVLFDIL